jgi:23S rRNA (uridine2552-2'-O)-methyltransferase
MPRSKSSREWLRRQARDPYVKKARAEGARSRARFKLEQLDARDRLLRPGMIVVDLGAAPGGWSEYAARRVAPGGRVVAADLLPMAPVPGVDFVRGDFADPGVLDLIKERLGSTADLVISDMAPNISGVAATDQARGIALAERAFDFAVDVLRPGGTFLVKAFQGEGFDALVRHLRERFAKVAIRKPGASRAESREVYLLARGFTGGRAPA